MTYIPQKIKEFNTNASEATRVAQMTTIFDGKILGADDLDLWENQGTGTTAYILNKLNLICAPTQYLVRQSRRFNQYFSGKSQLVEMSFDNFQTETNAIKRAGYFSSSSVAPFNTILDGFFIENNNGVFTLQAWREGIQTMNVNFTAMDNFAAIASYNWQNFTVIAFDFLWLGGTSLRLFVKTNNGFELIHTVNYAGSAQDVFIGSPNQPVRYELRAGTVAASFRTICSQVASEGSNSESGKSISIINYVSIATNTIGLIYALKGIRKTAAFRNTPIKIIDMSVVNTTAGDSGILMLIKNPTLSLPLTYTNNSKFQEANGTGTQLVTVNTGRVICAVSVGSQIASNTIMIDNFLSFLTTAINNFADEFVVAFMPTTSNQAVNVSVTLKEY